MFSLLLVLVALQGPPLTPVQAGVITRSVESALIPPDSVVGDQPIRGRTIVFDQAQTVAAFRHLVNDLHAGDITTTLPSLVMTRAKAITCAHGRTECSVSHDGIYFAITRVARERRPGEYRVSAVLRWGHKTGAGHTEVRGADYTMIVALVGKKWKQWKVIHLSKHSVR